MGYVWMGIFTTRGGEYTNVYTNKEGAYRDAAYTMIADLDWQIDYPDARRDIEAALRRRDYESAVDLYNQRTGDDVHISIFQEKMYDPDPILDEMIERWLDQRQTAEAA